MKFLFFLNVSNQENLSCDSGVIFHQLLFSPLLKAGHKISIVAPSFSDKMPVNLIKYDFGDNKYQVRFSFDWEKIKTIIENEQPDIVWVNQIELVSAFRALISTENYSCKLLSYCHYLPFYFEKNILQKDESLAQFGLHRSILTRIVEAVGLSDKTFIQSNFAKNQLIQLSEDMSCTIDQSKIVVLPPPADPFLFKDDIEVPSLQNKQILYNHRLYSQYGTDQIIELIEYYQSKKIDLSFVVTDMMSKRSKKRNSLDNSVGEARARLSSLDNVLFTDEGTCRSGYKNLLMNSSLALAAPRRACVWSMSVMDCLGMGVPVFAPDYAFYPELLPNEMLYKSKKELYEKIDTFFSESNRKMPTKNISSLAKEYLPEKIVSKLSEELLI